ncbi:MAG: hypothetical protein WA688_05795 [Thermoplasmata archaeon]
MAESTQIAALEAQVAALGQRLVQKHGGTSGPWYYLSESGGVMTVVVVALLALFPGLTVGLRGRDRGRGPEATTRGPGKDTPGHAAAPAVESPTGSSWSSIGAPPQRAPSLEPGSGTLSFAVPIGPRLAAPSGERTGPPD